MDPVGLTVAVGEILEIVAIACDLHQLFLTRRSRSRLSDFLSSFDHEEKSLDESMNSTRPKTQKEGAWSDAEDNLNNLMDSPFHRKQQVYFLCSNNRTASSIESKLPTLEKEPHYCLQPKRCRDNAIATPFVLCLIHNKSLGPLSHWVLLSSLHVEGKSSLSERIEQNLPKLSRISTVLGNTYALNFFMLLVSITCMILTASILVRNGDNKSRALITTITLFLLALAGSQWGSLGGSALEYFTLYMPFALSLGCSLGLALRHKARGYNTTS